VLALLITYTIVGSKHYQVEVESQGSIWVLSESIKGDQKTNRHLMSKRNSYLVLLLLIIVSVKIKLEYINM